MPHEKMNAQQIASYLGMSLKEVIRLASREKMPCRKLGDMRYLFRKSEVDHWVWERLHSFDISQIEDIEQGVIDHHGMDGSVPLVCPLLNESCVRIPLEARTAPAVIKRLASISFEAGAGV